MSQTRHERGSYARTDVQNEKTIASCKRAYENPELRKLISEKVRRAYREDGLAAKVSAGLRSSKIVHWTKLPENKERLRRLAKRSKKREQNFLRRKRNVACKPAGSKVKRTFSEVARRNISIAQQKRLRSRRETLYTSALGGHRDDLGMYFRSTWEANFARIMNHLGLTWEYEPRSFQLGNSLSYTPDFLINGTFYELKGRQTERSIEQIVGFKLQHPEHKLVVIDSEFWEILRVCFRTKVTGWEGR